MTNSIIAIVSGVLMTNWATNITSRTVELGDGSVVPLVERVQIRWLSNAVVVLNLETNLAAGTIAKPLPPLLSAQPKVQPVPDPIEPGPGVANSNPPQVAPPKPK